MMQVAIPGFRALALDFLVSDYNGTLARDGRLLSEARAGITRIASALDVHIITGDTFGTAEEELRGLPVQLVVMPADRQAEAKLEWIRRHGAQRVVAFGNGRNDRMMLVEAALGVGVIGDEGIAADAFAASDVVVRHVADAFGLLLEPRRLIASLRS
jgi:soluble P-type ATPase